MRILHTADWHIGKKLHSYDLALDFDRFVSWLCQCLRRENIDVLLISGDCFDLANPSSAARSQYYNSLITLKNEVDHIVITGGNHDSPAVLDAPKELMKTLNLDVIGGLPEDRAEVVIPLKNKKGTTEAVVAAIPFLRNPDLRMHHRGPVRTYEDRLAAMRVSIQQVFKETAQICQEKYPGIPAIAMGHLYAAGIDPSDSERDIQIGNQAAVQASAFDTYFRYVALGHIHKPQQVKADQPVFYSGSPLPLSFSERTDQKRVLLLDTEKGWQPQSIPIPGFRKLLKIKGDLTAIKQQLAKLPDNSGLEDLIEIDLREENYQTKRLRELETLVAAFERPGYTIVKHRAEFANRLRETGDLFEETVHLEELQPKKVFEERLNQEEFSAEDSRELNLAFAELLEELD